jgi:hypothetical protein
MSRSVTAPPEVTPKYGGAFDPLVIVRGIAGGVVGGVVGYLLFRWLLTQGFYALVLPGALLGLGAGLAARGQSLPLGIVCGAAALGLSIYAEWVHAPFKQDASFLYFVTHLHKLDGGVIKYVMMGLGTACAYWFGQGR